MLAFSLSRHGASGPMQLLGLFGETFLGFLEESIVLSSYIARTWQVKRNTREDTFAKQVDVVGFKVRHLQLETLVKFLGNSRQESNNQCLLLSWVDESLNTENGIIKLENP